MPELILAPIAQPADRQALRIKIISGITILILLGFVLGFWQSLFGVVFGQNQANASLLGVDYEATNLAAASLSEVAVTASPTDVLVVNQTATLTPTETPTVTPTPECQVEIRYYGISYVNNEVRISYRVPGDLDEHILSNQEQTLSIFLELPGFLILRNETEVEDYQTFLRDLDSTDLLFVEIIAQQGDVIYLEYYQAGQRFCSEPLTLLPPPVRPTAAPNQQVDEPSGAPPSPPLPTPTDEWDR